MHAHRRRLVRASALALLLLAPGEPVTIDLTTGLPAHAPGPAQPPPAVPADGATVNVLWDVSHGVELGYEPSGNYSELTAQLAADGYAITTTAEGILSVDLPSWDIVVICVGSGWDTAYTASEANALVRYVRGGGGLLVMADNADVPDTLELVTDAFFTVANEVSIQPLDLYFSTFAPHPVFDGVQSVYYRAAGIAQGQPPAQSVARTSNGEPVVVSVTGGRVLLLGDINVFDNTYIVNADNTLFASNVFKYLAGP